MRLPVSENNSTEPNETLVIIMVKKEERSKACQLPTQNTKIPNKHLMMSTVVEGS